MSFLGRLTELVQEVRDDFGLTESCRRFGGRQSVSGAEPKGAPDSSLVADLLARVLKCVR